MKLRTAQWLNVLIGACDGVTGILLLFFPAFTLRLMGIDTSPLDLVYLKYIGVFVFAVGASYYLPILFRDGSGEIESIRSTWRMTALIRFCIGIFVSIQILQGSLEGAWISVAATDISIGTLQVFLLKKGIDAGAR